MDVSFKAKDHHFSDPYSTDDTSAPTSSSGCGDDSGSSFAYGWVIAVVLCVLSAFIINFGTNLQKLAWNRRRKAKELESERSNGDLESLQVRTAIESNDQPSVSQNAAVLQEENRVEGDSSQNSDEAKFRRLWVLGFGCIVIGSIFDFAALGFGAQSIVAPLGSVSLVANMGFAQVMHGEKLTSKDIFATAIIFVGCILSVAFASHENNICDIETLLALYGKPRFFIYAFVVISLLTIGIFSGRRMDRTRKAYGARSEEYLAVEKYHRFCFAFLSGLSGAQSVLFAKSLDELLVSSISGNSKLFLAHIGSYLIAGGMFASVGMQLFWMNVAISRWDALYVVPVFQSNWIVFSVVGGGVFYGEFSGFSFGQSVAFLCGVSFTVLGVYFLSQRDVIDTDHLINGDDIGESLMEENLLSLTGTPSRRSHRSGSLVLSHVDEEDSMNLVYEVDSQALGDQVELGMARPNSAPYPKRVSALQNENALDTPLLSSQIGQAGEYSSAKSVRSWRSPFEEYDVIYPNPTMGLSVEPHTVSPRRSSSSASSFRAPPIKLWRVRATRPGSDPRVRVGHVIVAINDESVVGPTVRLPDVLEKITNGSRPIKVRFRTEPSAHQPQLLPDLTSVWIKTENNAQTSKESTISSSDGQESTQRSVSDEVAQSFVEAPTVTSTTSGQVSLDPNHTEDDYESEDSKVIAHGSLQGVSLNPLLELIHTWKDTEPSAFDKLAKRQDHRANRSPRLFLSPQHSTSATVDAASLRGLEEDLDLSRGRSSSESMGRPKPVKSSRHPLQNMTRPSGDVSPLPAPPPANQPSSSPPTDSNAPSEEEDSST